MGAIWAHEIDIFRSWRLISREDFVRIQTAHWRKLPYWIFTPLGLALLGSAGVDLVSSPDFAWLGDLGKSERSTHIPFSDRDFLGKWQSQLSKDERGPESSYLTKILSTHWIRTLLINAYGGILLAWAIRAFARGSGREFVCMAIIKKVPGRRRGGQHASDGALAAFSRWHRIAVQVTVVVFVMLSAAVAQRSSSEQFEISGRVTGGSGKHAIFVALWDADAFLKEPVKQVRIDPQASPLFRFYVPAGRWAISAFEDENNNGVLDLGRFGPKEPSGFWRAFHGWRKPRFDDVANSVDHNVYDADIALGK